MKKYYYQQIGLTILTIFLLSLTWEFFLEDLLLPGLGLGPGEPESIGERWEYVITVMIFVTIALIIPTWLMRRATNRQERLGAMLQGECDRITRIITGAPAIICGTTPDGVTTFINPSGEKITGYSAEALVGRNLWQTFYPEDEDRAVEQLLYGVEQEATLDYEIDLTTRHGDTRTIVWNSVKHFDEFGKLYEVTWFGNDITEQARAEESLRKQNEFVINALESLNHPFYVIDANDYTIKMANSAARLGELSETSTCYALTHKRSEPCRGGECVCPLEEVKKTGKPVTVEHIHYDKDDNCRIFEVHGNPIFDDEGNVIQMIEYSLDITERKREEEVLRQARDELEIRIEKRTAEISEANALLRQEIAERVGAEEALKQGEERYRAVVEQSVDCIFLVDAETGRILETNPALQRLLGYTPADLLGLTVYDFIAHEHADIDQKIRHVIAEGAHFIGERRYCRKDGALVDVEVSVNMIYYGGQKVMCIVSRDITRRKQTEEALQRRNRELSLLNRISQMFSSTLEFEPVLDTVLGEIRQLLNADSISFWVVAPETGELVCQQAKGPGSNIVSWRLAPGQGITGWVAKSGRGLVVPDTWADERYFKDADKRTGLVARSMLSIPLRAKGKVTGVLNLVDTRVGLFTQDNLALLEPVAAAAAISIENARLYREAQQEIVERKQVEEKLRKLSRAVEQSANTIVITDLDGTIEFVNPAFSGITGYSYKEAIGQNPRILKSGEHPPELYKELWQTISQGEVWQGELLNKKKNGELYWEFATISPVKDKAGKITHYLAIKENITERKQAEESLRQSEAGLAEAQRIARLGNWEWDIVANTVTWSDELYRVFGLEPQEFEASYEGFLARVHPDDRDDVNRIIEESLRTHEPFNYYRRIIRLDGTVRIIYAQGQVIVDDAGHPARMLGTTQDVTELKQAEEALLESEKRFRALFEGAPDAMFLADTESGKIIDVNPAASRLLSRPRDEIIGLHQTRLHPPRQEDFSKEAFVEHAQSSARGLQAHPIEHTVLREDGGETPVEITAQIIHTLGKPVLLGVFRDITERKQAEAELQKAKEVALEAQRAAERANKAKSAFLANMSHELRTPLNVILGFSQLMTRSQSISPEYRENLDIINRSGEHLLTLINDVLDMSKIEAGRIALNETDFDLYLLLHDLEGMFRFEAANKQLQLVFDHPPDMPQYIRTDEAKLRQVLTNLLNNAIKFTESGGVSLRVSELGEVGTHRTLFFEVEDTGPGIAPDELDNLFEAFAQTKTGQQLQTGTGLGLPISQKFVELMGGEITVSSEMGRGSVFAFDIQISPADPIQSPKSKIQNRIIGLEPGQPRYRILVVDNSLDNRQLLVKLLTDIGPPPFGFEIREAGNGREAIDIWAEWRPHLIWMDMRMPVMDGYEATKYIKSKIQNPEPKIETPIIALSAGSLGEEQSLALAAGCDDFISKPFREADVFEKMARHLGARYVYDEPEQKGQETEEQAKSEIQDLKLAMSEAVGSKIAALPADWLADLHYAASLADSEMSLELIEQIEAGHPQLAGALARLVDNFQFDKLSTLAGMAQTSVDSKS